MLGEVRGGSSEMARVVSSLGNAQEPGTCTLLSATVARVSARMYADARLSDPPSVRWAAHVLDSLHDRPSDAGLCGVFAATKQPVGQDLGFLLYALARCASVRTVVEFGTSLGASTLYIAAAIRDNGGGLLITTELDPVKAAGAADNLREAGLSDLVEIYTGNALQTLRGLDRVVDLVFLDGWQDRYLEVLRLIEPNLRRGTLVVADDVFEPLMADYLGHVRGPGYVSAMVKISSNVEVSMRSI
jgi:predicted O-methyltransferase YrrM